MGRRKTAQVVARAKCGHVQIGVQMFRDGRFGFDIKRPGEKRHKVRRATKEAALSEAKGLAAKLDAGRFDLLTINAGELAEFRAWKSKRTGSKSIHDVAHEFIASKEADAGLDPVYVSNLRGVLKLFGAAVASPIAAVTPAQIEKYLAGITSPINRNNHRAALVSLWRFARTRDYVDDRTTAPEKVPRLKIRRDERDIEVYSPDELRAILSAARRQFLPWLVLGAFAGVRSYEVKPLPRSPKSPLRWEDFRWSENAIAMRGATTKTGRARMVPICQTLLAWLTPWRKAAGDVLAEPCANEVTRLKTTGIKWRKNALRRSYGSYRLALIHNAAQVAEEIGSSVEMLRKTYHSPRTEQEAKAWFSVLPKRA